MNFKLAGNKLDKAAALDMVKNAFGDDPEIMKNAGEIIGACETVTDGDRCEAVYKIMECTDKEVKSRGIEI